MNIREKAAPPVDTVVIPLAGLGTRMYEQAAAYPKFTATVVDGDKARPSIGYTLDDCYEAGIRNYVFVYSLDGKRALKSYLGKFNREAKRGLVQQGKFDYLAAEEERRDRFSSKNGVNLEFVRQRLDKGKYGTSVPLALARHALKGVNRFAVYGGDDFIWHKDGTSELNLMLDSLAQSGASNTLMGKPVSRAEASKYGILQQEHGRLTMIDEKPPEARIPESPLANVSRYILGKSVWPYLEADLKRPRTDQQNEYYITDVINTMAADGHDFYVHTAQGIYLDAGSPQNLLRANMVINGIIDPNET